MSEEIKQEQEQEKDISDIVPAVPSIDSQIQDLSKQILEEQDPDKAKQLIAMFNWNMSKKNTSRIQKLDQLYDKVTEQMEVRLNTRSDQFSNSDLLDYMKAVQGAIDTSSKNLTQMEEPPTIVQQNNTQVNINVGDSFDRDSKIRIFEAIQAVLKSAETQVNNEPIIEVIPEESLEVTEEVSAEQIVVEESTNTAAADAIAELSNITEEKAEDKENE